MSKRVRRMLGIGVAAVIVLGALVATALYTDRPQFCTTCHEMVPYYDAWAAAPHHEVGCIDCHINPGLPARFAHKFVATKEVYAHLTGDVNFPRPVPPEVPSKRCERCHESIPATLKNGFPHGVHAEKSFCAECHFDTGHSVSEQALKDAGIFAAGVVPQRLSAELAKVGAGKANLPGHPAVSCGECHDMRALPCSTCHQPPAKGHQNLKDRDCSRCHVPAASFAFAHPGLSSKCADCHKAPGGKHPAGSSNCSSCHRAPGQTWKFSHPGVEEHNWRKIACAKCHPVSYAKVYCTCHKGRPPSD